MLLSSGLASSAISSSDRMHLRISAEIAASGSSPLNISSKESPASHDSPFSLSVSTLSLSPSRRPYDFTLAVFSSSPAILRSSVELTALPLSSLKSEAPISLLFPKFMEPFRRSRPTASKVSCWSLVTSEKSDEGLSSRHLRLPGSEVALSESISIILLYSRVFKTL